MGGGGGQSSSTTSTHTETISDSNNSTTNLVSNLSDAGNVTLSIGAGGGLDADALVKLLPFAIIGSVLVVVALVISKRS